ncbi:glycine decarboxylase subunit P [Malassezia pachydermatis]|uniref:Glycine cleavage system P protein n=1 Tax=Malassezia pachydermatis TaxID=77020 RepID=A0A0M9VNF4_9BASI|nr:glycine dehydrogenase [Malassezia pachydermatis]KOS13032.1 glycine dehydrogenase [Malassezia pachydermatis]
MALPRMTALRAASQGRRWCATPAVRAVAVQSLLPRRTLATSADPMNLETPPASASVFTAQDTFLRRHIGPRAAEIQHILDTLGYKTVDEFVNKTVPEEVRLPTDAVDPASMPALSESELAARARALADQNEVRRSFIGMGYQNTIVPPVIMRNVLENPAWYTSYTPYQPEISQGRLESLLNYQTMVKSLTGLDIANASLLDEGTAAAEAMILAYGTCKDKKRNVFLVDDKVLPQTLAVLRGRAKGFGIEIVSRALQANGEVQAVPADVKDRVMGVLVQYPDVDGSLVDWQPLAQEVKSVGGLVVAATDLLALTMIKPPAEWGADIAVGNAARFGVPPGYGGPHAGFFAATDALKRRMPGRLIGVSRDTKGRPAYRLSLQTREQHIRREKATSNICTAQALLANMSAMYAVYHGPQGLRRIAAKVHALTKVLKAQVENLGCTVEQADGAFFDTLTIQVPAAKVHQAAAKLGINLRVISDEKVGVTLDETVTAHDLAHIVSAIAAGRDEPPTSSESLVQTATTMGLSAQSVDDLQVSERFARTSSYLTQPVFNKHHSETALLRYIYGLQGKDLSLVHAMIPLGSCTMKLNSTSSMQMLSFPEYHALHPFVPVEQAKGYQTLIKELEADLAKLTGFDAVSLQPNSGAQGEFAGLSVIRAYLDAQGQQQRNVCLIPTSAHGTNPASAVMAGMKVVPVQTLADGTIDLNDLRAKAEKHKDVLAATMITEPGTTGIYFAQIKEAIAIVHEFGGQVYLDGANLQAQVGVTNPVVMGADVTHLNLHKTFSIPHGGGGPGVGPIGVKAHLAQYLPGHPVVPTGGAQAIEPISAAPWGSASILTIAWAYIRMLGWSGIRTSTITSLLNANYVKAKIEHKYKVKYVGKHGNVAHELLVDVAEFQQYGLQVMDFAKRLIDYGFHPPTCSWPISTGLLIEITESEPLEEMDRLCEALLSIAQEVEEIKSGALPRDNNMLKNAPHTIEALTSETWDHPYSRERAVYPVPSLRQSKFWPPVSRVDDAYGDRNLVCECGSVEEYA